MSQRMCHPRNARAGQVGTGTRRARTRTSRPSRAGQGPGRGARRARWGRPGIARPCWCRPQGGARSACRWERRAGSGCSGRVRLVGTGIRRVSLYRSRPSTSVREKREEEMSRHAEERYVVKGENRAQCKKKKWSPLPHGWMGGDRARPGWVLELNTLGPKSKSRRLT